MPELVITTAGRQAAIDANKLGLTVRMTRIAVGTGKYVPVATQTSLQSQVAVVDIAHGLSIGTDTLQVSGRFTAGAWAAYELGVILSDGTLFAVGSSATAGDFPTKELGTDVVVTVTLLISDVPSGSVQVLASVQTTVPNATTTERGIVELADAGDPDTDAERAVTLDLLQAKIDASLAALAGAAPAALDTLAEIAAALKNNPDIIADLMAAIALRARLDGAVFTGRTRGLTRPDNDDGRDFATTEWVHDNAVSILNTALGTEEWQMGFDIVDGLLLLSQQLAVRQTAAVSLAAIRTEYPAITRLQAALALQAGGYDGVAINAALDAVYNQTAAQYAGILAAGGYAASYTATSLLAAYPALTASQMAVTLLAAYPTLTASQMAVALLGGGYHGVIFSPRRAIETQTTTADFDDALMPTHVGIRYYGDGTPGSSAVGPVIVGYSLASLPVAFNPDGGGVVALKTSTVSYAAGSVTISINEDTGLSNYYWIDEIIVW